MHSSDWWFGGSILLLLIRALRSRRLCVLNFFSEVGRVKTRQYKAKKRVDLVIHPPNFLNRGNIPMRSLPPEMQRYAE